LALKDDISDSSEVRLQSLNVTIVPIKMDRGGANPVKDFTYLLRLIKVYKRIKPDVVLNYTPKPNIYSSLACQILNISYINTINGLGSGFMSGFPIANIMRLLYKLALRKSKRVFIHNHDDLNYFVKSGLSSSSISSFIPGSGIDVSVYQNDKEREPVPGSLRFLFAGRLNKEKGIYDFVYAAEQIKKRHPDCRFCMVGFIDESNPSSITSDELDELTASRVIEYKGKTDHIVEFLNTSDIMVYPSDREGMPRILLEAASCSMPIITYDVPGCREIVLDGYNGYLCSPGNRDDLKETCEKILDMQQADIVKLGKNGRKRIRENFTVETVNQFYISTLAEIL